MKVILIRDVEKVGKKGDIKDVSPGYIRNYLMPRNLAIEATGANTKLIEGMKKKQALMVDKEKKEFEKLAEEIKKLSITISRQVGEEDKMFGSVTSEDIAEALKNENVEVDKRKIDLPEPIKALGIFDVKIKIHPEVTATVKIWVVKA